MISPRKMAIALLLASIAGAAPLSAASNTAVLLVSHPADPGWQDLAVLAAIPASRQLSQGNGAVIALDEQGSIPREVDDYLRRLQAEKTYHLGATALAAPPAIGKHFELACGSADAAAIVLARTCWQESKRAVFCGDGDYGSALMAATLAARLQVPLFFCGAGGPSAEAVAAARQLQVREILFVGEAPVGMTATVLPDAEQLLRWLKQQGMETPYLAVTNIRDRSSTRVRKLSLAAPIIAAAHNGMVVPIDDEFHWREVTNGKPLEGDLPKGVTAGSKAPHAGVIEFTEGKLPFVLGFGADKHDRKLWLDLNGDGCFDGTDEGPLTRNGVVTLLGKPRTLDFREHYGPPCDLTVTTGRPDDVIRQLRPLYQVVGIPSYLCLVGFPDSIPMGILNHRQGDLSTDLPYGNTDADAFSEIAVGRIIAESSTYATLHASRTVTYHALLDPSWSSRAGQARWENTMGTSFENVGLDASAYHEKDDLGWIKRPVGKDKGERKKSIDPKSPLTSVAFLSHMDHSWWKQLGHTYHMNAGVLLAPTIVESGGCLTGNLDAEPEFRSVVARLFRNGAVSFCGQTRPGIAQQEQQRMEFWNGVFTGMTIGEAHLRANNSKATLVIETGQMERGGGDHYQLQIRTLFGDPALKPQLPSPPRSAPARVDVDGDLITVHAPSQWWITPIRVPEDWKQWVDKPLHVIRGLGTYANRSWCKEQYDHEEIYFDATLTTARRIKSIEQVDELPKPLGWTGKFTVDEHADGTRTYHWRVRLIDFDQISGKIISQAERITFRVRYAP